MKLDLELYRVRAQRLVTGKWFVDSRLRHQENAFTVLRWLLASAVIYSHSFVLTGNGSDPTTTVLPMPISTFAVRLFFTLSGFLVTGSLYKRGVMQFVFARASRLLPGLWAMLLVTACCVSIIFEDTISAHGIAHYVIGNGILANNALVIAGSFSTNFVKENVNGSLWTLRHEAHCYIVLAIIGAFGFLRRRKLLLFVFIISIIVQLASPINALSGFGEIRRLGTSFAAGSIAYLWRSHLFLSWPLAILALIVPFLVLHDDSEILISPISMAYAMFVCAFNLPKLLNTFSANLPDYSYGIYIYAYPIQQVLVYNNPLASPYENAAETFLLSVSFAAASWHLIEKPGMLFGHNIWRRSKWQR